MAHRADLNSLAPAARQQLVNLMLQYIDDAVVADHMNIVHSGLELFTGHRAYIAWMEAFLSANGGAAFVPLPFWNPASPIPPEFNVVKPEDGGTPRPALVNLNPNMPLPSEWDYPAVCEFESGADLGNAINGWHGSVHIAIGGTMSSIMIASAAPIFWCWHAFVDHIYWNWQMCQLTCPDLVGCPLEIAKLKIKHAGLKLGCVTRLPRYCVPPAQVPVGYAPRPDEYLQGHVSSRTPQHHHEHAAPGHQAVSAQGEMVYETSHVLEPGAKSEEPHSEKPSPLPVHQHESLPAPVPPGEIDPRDQEPFRHPTPDYSHLLRSPVVIQQSPAMGMQICIHGCVDLVVITD